MSEAERLAAAWGARVRANRAQAERVREHVEADFYGTTSRRFVVDPRRTDDPALDALVALARPAETWLDIGAGAGRFALPLALVVREVIALDPSPAMLAGLRAGMAEHGISNIRVIEGRWPFAGGGTPGAEVGREPRGSAGGGTPGPEVGGREGPASAGGSAAFGPSPAGDVSLMAHVGYDIEEIGPFLDAAEQATRRLCVAVMADRAPSSPAAIAWPAVHAEERILLPALPELVELLRARGSRPTIRVVEESPRVFIDRDEAHAWIRHQCFIAAGGEADERLAAFVAGLPVDDAGRVALPTPPLSIGVVTWPIG